VQNVYLYERLLKSVERERAYQQRHAQQLRAVGVADHTPRAWFTLVVALFAFLRLG